MWGFFFRFFFPFIYFNITGHSYPSTRLFFPFAFFPALLVSFPLLLFTLPILRNIFLTSPVMNPAPFLQSHITHPKVNASQDKKCVFPCLGSVPCSKVLAMRLNICFST